MSQPSIVALVGCGAAKLTHAAPARELYTSTLFTKARAWAEARAGEWAILSALHGLVEPWRVIGPYEYRLPARRPARAEWDREVAMQVRTRWPNPGAVRLVILAGVDYTTWAELLPPEYRARLELPLLGMQIGERLQALTGDLAGGARLIAASRQARDGLVR